MQVTLILLMLNLCVAGALSLRDGLPGGRQAGGTRFRNPPSVILIHRWIDREDRFAQWRPGRRMFH